MMAVANWAPKEIDALAEFDGDLRGDLCRETRILMRLTSGGGAFLRPIMVLVRGLSLT